MGLFSSNPVQSAQEEVNRCQALLAAKKADRDLAKKSGNYKNASKNYRFGSKEGTVYDYNVWNAEEHLKRAKEKLAAAKRR
jgi:hypothetical protein